VPALKECNADILRMAGVPLGLDASPRASTAPAGEVGGVQLIAGVGGAGLALQLLTYLRKARIVLPELGRERGESVASGSTVGGSTVGP
jgi:hypothetical protein